MASVSDNNTCKIVPNLELFPSHITQMRVGTRTSFNTSPINRASLLIPTTTRTRSATQTGTPSSISSKITHKDSGCTLSDELEANIKRKTRRKSSSITKKVTDKNAPKSKKKKEKNENGIVDFKANPADDEFVGSPPSAPKLSGKSRPITNVRSLMFQLKTCHEEHEGDVYGSLSNCENIVEGSMERLVEALRPGGMQSKEAKILMQLLDKWDLHVGLEVQFDRGI
ncbi:base excision DNA repair protein [Colletotrichum lupini]|uniref:Base excision DNA repair protein n=1 Tax=Colletotrichum lupini TaxID=145971 RepID=A0A9Q8WEX9_9PEZI|nr:base excision DNA repair protein [Colletotrichum lupini]UQC81218.1 base excision DNA repair protein [Colletotrichum lupini]